MENFEYIKQYMDYVEKCQSKKLVLFGAGNRASEIIKEFFRNDKIEFICDNDSTKWGKQLDQIPICSPKELCNHSDECMVLVTMESDFYVQQVTAQLSNMGILDVYTPAILEFANRIERYEDSGAKKFHERNTFQQINKNFEKMQQVRSMLCDEKSRNVYDDYIFKMKYNIRDYTDICDDVYDHYFSDGVFEYGEHEVFVDVGAFDGVDTMRFAQMIGSKFKKSYCFEPDDSNYMQTCKNISSVFGVELHPNDEDNMVESDAFTIFKSGLYNKNAGVTFANYGAHSSRFIESGDSKAIAVRLDDVIDPTEKVTLIKMDIEGTEMVALEGAKGIIQKDKPKLAICIYHKIEDLWDIPLYIHALVPEYKFFVRHHTSLLWDKVLYATI